MGINQCIPLPQAGTVGAIDEMTFHMRLVTTTAGVLSTSLTWVPCGVTVVKTGSKVGRYTVTLPTPFDRLLNVIVTGIGPTDATWGANTTGNSNPAFIRNDNVSRTVRVAGSTMAGTVDIQFPQTSGADAELPDGLSVMVTIIVARGDAP